MVRSTRVIELVGKENALSLTIGTADWTQVSLVSSGQCLPLGAERLQYIVSSLLVFLNTRQDELKWMLSLSELHFSMYGRREEGNNAVLRIQDPSANFVASVELDSALQRRWHAALKELEAK